MIKHLKPRQEYVDRYDRMTVEDCRWRENFFKKDSEESKTDLEKNMRKLVGDIGLYFDLLYTTLKWYDEKEATVNKWMSDDQNKDQLLENTEPPEGIRCLKCHSLMSCSDKSIHDWSSDNRDRVLFMFDCPKGCVPRRAFFDDGEEWRIKPDLCSKCKTEFDRTSERVEDKKIVITKTCPNCQHVETEEFDLSAKEEKPDPDYLKDRARFCLTKEEADKKREEKWRAEEMGKLTERLKEDEKNKKVKEAIANIKKVTVTELEKMLAPICEGAGYIKFQTGAPDMGKDLFLPFTVQENKSERTEGASTHDLQKLLKKTLTDTNWRLMSDGISYRMGILSGRLRAYEREEDLLKLLDQKDRKN